MTAPTPFIDDIRPDGHNSLNTLPRIAPEEYELLRSFYGFEHLTYNGYDAVNPGDLYFQLFLIELKAGPANIQPVVFDRYEGRAESVLMWLSWPGAQTIPQEANPKYKTTAVHCWTDDTGSCGWAYGPESHIGPDGGPYTVWPNIGSGPHGSVLGADALDKIGWWDDHITPNPWFQVAMKGGDSLPPTTGDAYLVDLAGDGQTILKHIRWIEGAPPTPNSYGFLAFMQDGEILLHIPWEGQG